jgi:hypothetical protein
MNNDSIIGYRIDIRNYVVNCLAVLWNEIGFGMSCHSIVIRNTRNVKIRERYIVRCHFRLPSDYRPLGIRKDEIGENMQIGSGNTYILEPDGIILSRDRERGDFLVFGSG